MDRSCAYKALCSARTAKLHLERGLDCRAAATRHHRLGYCTASWREMVLGRRPRLVASPFLLPGGRICSLCDWNCIDRECAEGPPAVSGLAHHLRVHGIRLYCALPVAASWPRVPLWSAAICVHLSSA